MNQKGQALIVLIVAVAITISILTTALLLAVDQIKRSGRNQLAQAVYYAAESGAEYGIMKVARDPGSCGGSDNLTINSTQININYSPTGSDCLVESSANENNITKKVQVQTTHTNNTIRYCCWQEIP